jgi:hypothetical protein
MRNYLFYDSLMSIMVLPSPITHAEIEKEIEDLYDKSSDLPIANHN